MHLPELCLVLHGVRLIDTGHIAWGIGDAGPIRDVALVASCATGVTS